jgi:hypothetical protein
VSDGNFLILGPDYKREILGHVWDSFPWELERHVVVSGGSDSVGSEVDRTVNPTSLGLIASEVVCGCAVGDSE